MSPDFSKMMFYHEGTKKFLIVDSRSGQFISETEMKIEVIEKGGLKENALDFKETAIRRAYNSFKWIDNDHYVYIDQEGIERCLRVEDGFEVGYSVVPQFKLDEVTDHHFYYEHEQVSKLNANKRLLQQYRKFKHLYYTRHIRDYDYFCREFVWIDTLQACHDKRFRLSMPFTYLGWKMLELL